MIIMTTTTMAIKQAAAQEVFGGPTSFCCKHLVLRELQTVWDDHYDDLCDDDDDDLCDDYDDLCDDDDDYDEDNDLDDDNFC